MGDGTFENRNCPVRVSGLYNVEKIAVGSVHAVALKKDGTIWSWGENTYGQFGNGKSGGNHYDYDENIDSNIPIKIDKVDDQVKDIFCGDYSTYSLMKDRSLWYCGRKNEGSSVQAEQLFRMTSEYSPGTRGQVHCPVLQCANFFIRSFHL